MKLDSEVVIREVRKNPILYDCEADDYHSKTAKNEVWKIVAESVVGDMYNHLDKAQKEDLAKNVQKKWKSLKDAFMRSLKEKEVSRGRKKRRPYVYHHQMAFLQLLDKPLSLSLEDEVSNPKSEKDAVLQISCVESVPSREEDQSHRTSVSHIGKEVTMGTLREIPAPQYLPEDDPDKMFLHSLLPRIKQLNSSAVLDFQINVLQLLQGYLNNADNITSSVPVNVTMAHSSSQ